MIVKKFKVTTKRPLTSEELSLLNLRSPKEMKENRFVNGGSIVVWLTEEYARHLRLTRGWILSERTDGEPTLR